MSTRQERRRQERLAKKDLIQKWADGKEKNMKWKYQLIQPWSVPIFKTTLPPDFFKR